MILWVSAGSNHDGAKDTCTPQVACPSSDRAAPVEPVERKTPEPASAADIFTISRRLRSPMEYVAILSPFQHRTLKATRRLDIPDASCKGEKDSGYVRP